MGAWVELSEGLHGHQLAPRQRNRSHGWQYLQLSHELHTKPRGPLGGQKTPGVKGHHGWGTEPENENVKSGGTVAIFKSHTSLSNRPDTSKTDCTLSWCIPARHHWTSGPLLYSNGLAVLAGKMWSLPLSGNCGLKRILLFLPPTG